ncbi:hypothetical protein B0H17DRAFT_480235 [Mycena rosella]|uniref:Uncharacterized protein n=1 Tax=Mycena rosella TaxID=1033263 RepID=A0AAD7GGH0_MYCRO|nr:hypothetical protein B0H17DRAFT_480235 [Mycena rosella]
MLPADYPQDLFDLVVDCSAGDLEALGTLSLVDKRFLPRTRRLVFNDFTIHVCGDLGLHRKGGRCGTSHCIIRLSPLLRSSHCFIPRNVSDLALSGRGVDIVARYSYSKNYYGGGMDDANVVLFVLKHFRDTPAPGSR